MFFLNIVFHRIVKNVNSIRNRYTVDVNYFFRLMDGLHNYYKSSEKIRGIRIYFDDNFKLPREVLLRVIECSFECIIAVPVESISKLNRYSYEELLYVSKEGAKIVPHGFSHCALAVYTGNVLLSTPSGGKYQNVLSGKSNILREQEVKFQLLESKLALQKWTPKEFVLPYGLYNQDTILINNLYQAYPILTTCDENLDSGEMLRPRFLVTNELLPKENIKLLESLRPRNYENNSY